MQRRVAAPFFLSHSRTVTTSQPALAKPFRSYTFWGTRIPKTVREPHYQAHIGPRSRDVFGAAELVALFTQDVRFSAAFYDLKTHMVGYGRRGHDLTSEHDPHVEILKAINRQRLGFLCILALRHPDILMFAQKLYHAKQQASISPADLEQMKKLITEKFGKDIIVGPYTEKEMDMLPLLRKKLMESGKSPYEAVMSLDIMGFISAQQEVKIAADVAEPTTERRLGL